MATILLAEDDYDLREMLKNALEKHRHKVIESDNGRDAFQKAESFHIDLVITDLLMPDQDGIGLIIELKKSKPDIKVVAMSGGGKVGPGNYLDIAKTLGADSVFPKPFKLQDMVMEVSRLLDEE